MALLGMCLCIPCLIGCFKACLNILLCGCCPTLDSRPVACEVCPGPLSYLFGDWHCENDACPSFCPAAACCILGKEENMDYNTEYTKCTYETGDPTMRKVKITRMCCGGPPILSEEEQKIVDDKKKAIMAARIKKLKKVLFFSCHASGTVCMKVGAKLGGSIDGYTPASERPKTKKVVKPRTGMFKYIPRKDENGKYALILN